MKRILFLILFFLCFPSQAFLLRPELSGVRALGMGNAFLAISDDNNVLWYNPAVLSRMNGIHSNMFDISMGVNSSDTLSRIGGALFDGEYANLIAPDNQYMQFSVKPMFLSPYFAFSFYDNIYSFTDFRDLNSLNASADVYTYNDLGAILGFSIPFGDYVSGGATIRLFQRTSVDAQLTTQSILESLGLEAIQDFQGAIFNHLQSMAGTGWAVGLNLGCLVRVPLAVDSPEFLLAATVNDVGYTSFRALGSAASLPPIRMKYNFGTALRYKLTKRSEFNLAMDFRDYFHFGHQGSIFRRLHFGAEYRNNIFGVRIGLHQAYPTLGFSITTPPHTQIHFATYAHELGNGLLDRMYRVYQIQLVIGFNPI